MSQRGSEDYAMPSIEPKSTTAPVVELSDRKRAAWDALYWEIKRDAKGSKS
jgi:hypothetical protein